jgi:hypothetical protein
MENGYAEYNSTQWNWGPKWSDPDWFSALGMRSWLPPEDVWPELATLRKQHIKLLEIRAREQEAYSALQRKFEAEDKQYNIELEAHIARGKVPEDTRQTLDARKTELDSARERVEAANKVLRKFLEKATAEIQARAPEWYEKLERRRTEEDPKIAEARRLLAEHEEKQADAYRMHEWLDRETGRVKTGHLAFSEMTGEYEPLSFVSPDATPAFEFEEEGVPSEVSR